MKNAVGLNTSQDNIEKLSKYLKDLNVTEEINKLSHNLRTKCTIDVQDKLSYETIFAITSFYLLLRNNYIIVIDCEGIENLNSQFRSKFLDLLCHNIVIIYSNDLDILLVF